MQLPFKCACGSEQMVDVETLEVRVISKLLKVEGFTCVHGTWNPLFYISPSLEEAMQRLSQMSITHKNFPYYFAKTLRKAAGVQRKWSGYGAF